MMSMKFIFVPYLIIITAGSHCYIGGEICNISTLSNGWKGFQCVPVCSAVLTDPCWESCGVVSGDD